MKKIGEDKLLVMKTDKSGKLSVTNKEKYLEMGMVHVGDDREVGRERIRDIDKLMNEHSTAWVNIWKMGENHEHTDRIITSKTSRSENTAKLYLAYKDHKKEPEKTRPIGTANTSNTRALANCVSELLEAVANSEETPYEVISTEDLLHHIKKHNVAVKEIRSKMEEDLRKRRRCGSCRKRKKG